MLHSLVNLVNVLYTKLHIYGNTVDPHYSQVGIFVFVYLLKSIVTPKSKLAVLSGIICRHAQRVTIMSDAFHN